ncbi:MAG: pyruvate formate lyase family protein [Eubacterium ramulus]
MIWHYDGYSPMLKKKLGISTGDARKFDSFEEVYSAFKKQFSYLVPYMHLYKNMDKLDVCTIFSMPSAVCVDAGLY